MKKIIPSLYHVCIDYSIILILLAGPSVFISDAGVTAKCTSLAIGVFLAVMNILTSYEGGIIRVINMKTHLIIDRLMGMFFLLSPWLFGFVGQSFLLHLSIGVILLAAGILTDSEKSAEFLTH